jgi:hypothetical protein
LSLVTFGVVESNAPASVKPNSVRVPPLIM